jgi:hypothetical protein
MKIIETIEKGIIKAWLIPTLPISILNFNNNIIIRTLQIINIITIFIIFINEKIIIFFPINNLFFILLLINIIYFIIIYLIKIIYSIKQIYNLNLGKNNLNIYSIILYKLVYFIKLICLIILFSLTLYILNIIIEKVLEFTEQGILFNFISEVLKNIFIVKNIFISNISNIQEKFTNFSLNYLNNLNFINFLKLIVILLLIIINFYLILINNEKHPNVNKLKESGMNDDLLSKILGMGVTSVGLVSFFKGLRADKFKEVSTNLQQSLELIQTSMEFDESISSEDKRLFYELKGNLFKLMDDVRNNKINDSKIMKELIALQAAKINDVLTSTQSRRIEERIRYLNSERTSDDTLLEWQIRTLEDKLDKLTRVATNCSDKKDFFLNNNEKIFSFDNITEYFDKYSSLEKLAIINLIYSNILIGSLISIVFIFYGEFLIKYFNLEKRYPKLAKFIQLRRKFQHFFFIYNVLWILLILLAQVYVYLNILSINNTIW